MSTSPDSGLTGLLKGNVGPIVSGVLWVGLALFSWFGRYQAQDTNKTDRIAVLEKQVADLQQEVANDVATRREVDGLRDDVKDLRGLMMKELQFHGIK